MKKDWFQETESSKTHIYTPLFAKGTAQEQYISKMIKTLFSGK
jgi:predicted transcriptional regulator